MPDPGLSSTHPVDFIALREALEASWSARTSYGGVWEEGNPALGQCYPTARVVQHFLPTSEIVKGTVWTGTRHEVHFWSELTTGGEAIAVDLTWQQFPPGSIVTAREALDRSELGDSPATVARCDRLLADVQACLLRAAIGYPTKPQRYAITTSWARSRAASLVMMRLA